MTTEPTTLELLDVLEARLETLRAQPKPAGPAPVPMPPMRSHPFSRIEEL